MNNSFKYLPPEQRKKILLICDDIRVHSGVATVAREIVIKTAHHFNWVNLAGSIKHPEQGKRLDVSSDTNINAGIDDSYVMLYPVDNYGNPDILRQLIELEKPDAIMLITDPRYFEFIFQMESELRKKLPITYLNIWDDYPTPLYNKAYYEACDLLMGISKQTVNINKLVLGDKKAEKVIRYIPHGLDSKIFSPITENDTRLPEFNQFKQQVFGKKEYDYVVFFNSRNVRRKQVPDTMLAFRYFLDKLPKEKAEKCVMLLHTEIVSDHGTDLIAIKELLFEGYENNIIFHTDKISSYQMNYLYNMSDAQILISSNEGWGLSLTESILVGNPVIANVTGGMQDQLGFRNEKGEWIDFDAEFPSNHTGKYKKCGEWAFPVFPSNRSIQGSPKTPYIWDDRCNAEDAAKQIMNIYLLSKKERKEIGMKGREFAINEGGFTSERQADRIIEAFDTLFKTWTPRKNYEFINVNKIEKKVVPHKLLY
jgi:glycosyltransferase involved in cell wall biosynthesis